MAEQAPTTFTLEPFDYGEARTLMVALDLAEPIAVTLVRRGYRTPEAARAFLDAAEDHDPFLFGDMPEVVDRIRAAAEAGRRITVHGDYDVDGVCSTAIAVRAMRRLGADCDWLIPDRMGDGYGLTVATVEALAARGTELLVTTDCGIGSVAEVDAARAAGMDVIVTDHHQPGAEFPKCPILHPAVSGYPFAELCATAVAYKLAAALHGAEAVECELDLVALATVADLVPLRGENRSLVRRGLAEARKARRPGMRALLASAAVVPERLDEGDFGFRLGPRINAAGRLYRADAGVELMLTDDPERAERIAAELERANRERREVELEVLRGAEQALAELPDSVREAPGLMIAGEGWHPGVVGIVASRLAERLWRPVVLVALDSQGRGRGSGRSVPGFDLLAALDRCAEHLVRYGGHRAAAGVEIEGAALESFRTAFASACEESMPAGGLARDEAVDAVVGADGLGLDVAQQLTRLAPFGLGNPSVRLLVPGAKLADVRPMGEGEQHARFALVSGSRRALGVAFGVNGSLAAAAPGPLDVSVGLELNQWNGAIEPRVVLGGIYADGDGEARAPEEAAIGEAEFWRRFDAELALEPSAWPPRAAPAGDAPMRERVERHGGAIVATLAALASGGGAVLVVCADALRRRELVERAARPARFGGGELALCSARLSDDATIAAGLLRDSGSGVVLCDWGALGREPRLARGFTHVLVVDPPPFTELEAPALAGPGYVHLLDGPPEAEFALRCHADEWPSRSSLGELYRSLAGTDAGAGIGADAARDLLTGEGRAHPRGPETAARPARVLGELGLIRWEGSGATRVPSLRPPPPTASRLRMPSPECDSLDPGSADYLGDRQSPSDSASEADTLAGGGGRRLRVVSSEGTDLDRSGAYKAYRERCEEGRRCLNQRRQRKRTPG